MNKAVGAMNEPTVRAEVLDPLLRRLGYRHNTDMDILREHQFRYPKVRLGRTSNADAKIIGYPDYICSARGIATWVLEAKAEGESLGTDADEQAFSYAVHPEIRAIYYCLSDGKRFLIYSTLAPVGNPPLLDVSLENEVSALAALNSFLSAESLARTVKERASIADATDFKVIVGKAHFKSIDWNILGNAAIKTDATAEVEKQLNLLDGTIYPIEGGMISQQDDELNVCITLGGQSEADLEFQKLIKIDTLTFTSVGRLSSDADSPTLIQTTQKTLLRPGDTIQSSRVAPQRLPVHMPFVIFVDASIYRDGDMVRGKFSYSAFSSINIHGQGIEVQLSVSGDLELHIRAA